MHSACRAADRGPNVPNADHAREHPPVRRPDAAGAAAPAGRGVAGDRRRQGRVAQPRRQRQGPRRRGHDRRGRATRLAPPRRHDHRGDRRQYRRRAGHGRRRQGLPLHLRAARQDERREDPPAQGLRRRGRHHADRRRRPTRPRATTASPTAWPARSPAPGGPTSSPTWPTPRSTTAPPARRSGSRPRAAITAFVAGVGTGGTISGVGRYLKERNPDVKVIGADPEGSVLSGDAPKPWKVEGIGEDFVPKTLQQPGRRRLGPRRRRRDRSTRPGDLARREGILVGGSSGHGRRRRPALCPPADGRRPGRRPLPPTPAATT